MTVLPLYVIIWLPLKIILLPENHRLIGFVVSVIREHGVLLILVIRVLLWTPQGFNGRHEIYLGFEKLFIAYFV